MPRPKPTSAERIARGVKRHVRRADHAASTREAFELRASGASVQEVADKLFNGNAGNASRSIKREIAARGVDAETVAEVLEIELARLDAMLVGIYEPATQGDLAAIDRVLKIQDRRTAYLALDAPKPTASDLAPPTPVRVEFVFVEDEKPPAE